jgi:hypothetical protein
VAQTGDWLYHRSVSGAAAKAAVAKFMQARAAAKSAVQAGDAVTSARSAVTDGSDASIAVEAASLAAFVSSVEESPQGTVRSEVTAGPAPKPEGSAPSCFGDASIAPGTQSDS